MRKIIPLLFSIVLLCASCVREAEFDDNFNTAYNNMGDALVLGITMAEEISQVWYKAIFENKMPNGRYCSDYNDALKELFATYKETGKLDSLETLRTNMQVSVSKLNNPPSSRVECYNDFVEIVSDVNTICRMASMPTGALFPYRTQLNETEQRILKNVDDFKIRYSNLFSFSKM